MANIKIADLESADYEMFCDTELSPKEIAAINGGSWLGTLAGSVVGSVGLLAGPEVGAVTIILGAQIVNALI